VTDVKKILVTGSGGPLGANITRSLGKAPGKIWMLGTEANRYHVHLSLTDETRLIPSAKSGEPYLQALENLAAEFGIEMFFPTHPVEVRTLAAHRDRFKGVRLFLPPLPVIKTADSKWETHQLLEKAGLPVPRTFLIRNEEDLKGAFKKIIERPVWVRGAGTPGTFGIGVASLPCREVEHAKAWIDHFKGWGGFIASEYLPGKNLTWTGVFKDGELIACQSRERLEYVLPHVSPSGITGAPAVSKTVHRSDAAKIGEAAIRALTAGKPHGAFFADFKEDPSGVPRVTEINAGRLGTTIHFYTEAGFNFPHLLVKLAYGEKIPNTPIVDPIPPETYWIRTLDCGPVLVRDIDHAK
jgi:biotin carboxylase